jgi:hypothetical protein
MKLTDLPLDTWVVVEPVTGNEVKLLSKHATQHQAEVERDRRNEGRDAPRCQALKTLAPIPSAQACAAQITHRR